jgi:hypothetical protein
MSEWSVSLPLHAGFRRSLSLGTESLDVSNSAASRRGREQVAGSVEGEIAPHLSFQSGLGVNWFEFGDQNKSLRSSFPQQQRKRDLQVDVFERSG